MEPGGPSPPLGELYELRIYAHIRWPMEGVARLLLAAAHDVVVTGAAAVGGRRAAVYAAHGTERRDAAGT